MDDRWMTLRDRIVVASAADADALLRRAATAHALPPFKTVDPSAFLPTLADDALEAIMDFTGFDVHHAARIAAACPRVLASGRTIPALADLHAIIRRLVADGRLLPAAFRPDPERVVLLNDVEPPDHADFRASARFDLLDADPSPIRLIETADEKEQLRAVAALVAETLSQGVPPDDVLIVNASPAAVRKLARLSAAYGFTVVDDATVPLDRVPLGAAFLATAADDPLAAFDRLRTDPANATAAGQAALDAIASILSRHGNEGALRPGLLAFECAREPVRRERSTGVVRSVPHTSLSGYDARRIFILDYLDDAFPSPVVDDDYLRDVEKAALGLETAVAANLRNRKRLGAAVASLKRVVLFRPREREGTQTRPAFLLEGLRPVRPEPYAPSDHLQSESDGFLTYAKGLHEERAFGRQEDGFSAFSARFSTSFDAYDPAFAPLSEASAMRLRGRRTVLSATSVETFHRCRFRFLCDHLLKLAPYAATDSQELGKIAHKALRDAFADAVPAADSARRAAAAHADADPRLAVLGNLLAKRLEIVEDRLRGRDATVRDFAHEREFEYAFEHASGFVVKGTIDRVAILEREGGNLVFVVDYKTGATSFSRTDFAKGTDIQPVFYLHLLEKTEAIPGAAPGGFHYQPVTLGRIVRSDVRDMVADALRLDGLILASREAVDAVGGPAALRNVRIKDDGNFYERSAVADAETLSEMVARIDGFIAEAVAAIVDGSYAIDPEPRPAGRPSASCEYCENRGICYSVDRIPEIAVDESAIETEDE
ncbi:MAG: PD-(D/E)XK nuclease family protein [Candidatus Izemoplasmatales bacterium]